jgi:hypothetical protein
MAILLAFGLLSRPLMIHFATIDLWTDTKTGKDCRLTVSDDGCEVEIRAKGERMLTAWYPTVSEALASARERQPRGGMSGPRFAV